MTIRIYMQELHTELPINGLSRKSVTGFLLDNNNLQIFVMPAALDNYGIKYLPSLSILLLDETMVMKCTYLHLFFLSFSRLALQLANVLRLQQKFSNSCFAGKHFPVNGQTIKVHCTGKPIDLHVFNISMSWQVPFFQNVHLFLANRFPTELGTILISEKL